MKTIKWPKKTSWWHNLMKWITIISIINQKIDIINCINSIFSDDIKMSYNLSLFFFNHDPSRCAPGSRHASGLSVASGSYRIHGVFHRFPKKKTPYFPWFGKNIIHFFPEKWNHRIMGGSIVMGIPQASEMDGSFHGTSENEIDENWG